MEISFEMVTIQPTILYSHNKINIKVIILRNAEKILTTQHPFIITILKNLGIEERFLNLKQQNKTNKKL